MPLVSSIDIAEHIHQMMEQHCKDVDNPAYDSIKIDCSELTIEHESGQTFIIEVRER